MSTHKREDIRAQRTRKKRQQRTNTILWIVGIVVILVILLASPSIFNALKPAGEFVRITPEARPLENGKGIGDPNAPVKIQAFEDFQCPSCNEYSKSIEKQLLESSYITDGKVYYEFMQYPFIDQNSVTKESHQAANASMCALEQGRFWDFHDMMFANQGSVENGGSFNDKRLTAFAEALGLDMTAYNQCFKENKYAAEISAEFKEGETLGVKGTPSIFVNGKHVTPGFVPTFDELKTAIDAALSGS